MSRLSEATDLDLLYSAIDSPIGVLVETNNVERLQARLYKVRRDHVESDPRLANISLKPSPISPTTQLWIINKNAPTDPTQEAHASSS